MDDVVVIAGGIIPDDDRVALKGMGVAAVFGPGTPTSDIADFIKSAVDGRKASPARVPPR